jgi:putative toxin-antitoxin system antitoxin component (TIGR02293 family)
MALMPSQNRKTAMSVLTLAAKSPTAQITAIEKGLPSSALNEIATTTGIPKRKLIEALRFAQRTITQRERAGSRFTMEESERLLRVVRLRHLLKDVFTTEEAIAEWLDTPDEALSNRTPLEMLATDVGAAKVENLAKAMIHGVPV